MTVQQLIDLLTQIEDKDHHVILAQDNESGIFSAASDITLAHAEYRGESVYVFPHDYPRIEPEVYTPAIIIWPTADVAD